MTSCGHRNVNNLLGCERCKQRIEFLNRTYKPVSGEKFDQEKPPMDLLPAKALVKMAEVLAFGAGKYSKHNWRGGIAWSRLIAAVYRHLTAFNDGQDKDPETGISHLAHAAVDLSMLLEFEETRKDLDDRYKEIK